jgi:hypothetical protein
MEDQLLCAPPSLFAMAPPGSGTIGLSPNRQPVRDTPTLPWRCGSAGDFRLKRTTRRNIFYTHAGCVGCITSDFDDFLGGDTSKHFRLLIPACTARKDPSYSKSEGSPFKTPYANGHLLGLPLYFFTHTIFQLGFQH